MSDVSEYRDVHNHNNKDYLEIYLKKLDSYSMSSKQKDNIKRFVELLKLGKIGSKVKNRRIINYIQFIFRLFEYFNKDLDKITEKEAEQFYKDLQENKIKKKNGMPYSNSSKDEFVKTIKRYLGWSWGKDSTKYHKSIRWMKEADTKSNKKAITLKEVEKVLNKEKYVRNKCLFMFMFDSGGRIEEVLNVRFEDIKNSSGKNKYFLVHLRGTKTEESNRTIPIPLTTKYLNEWIKEHPTKEGYLFPIQYDNARKIIKQMTKKVLKIEIKPHELRHSSCTHYIQFGGFGAENIGGFYYRYGWRFGSKEALTYIKTYLYGGELGQDKVVQHIISDRMQELEQKIKKLEERNESIENMLHDVVETLNNQSNKLKTKSIKKLPNFTINH